MIDTHLHLWRLGTGWYGWNTPALGAVHADSQLADVASAMAEVTVIGVVVVQAADLLAETDALLRLAAQEPLVRGVVGYLPVSDPARLTALLADHPDPALIGVRQLWHDHDDATELASPATITGLRLLGEAGLPVDVPDAHPRLWPALLTAADQASQTTFVLDHCGKPPFGDPAAWSRWEDGFRRLVSRRNVVVKLSGLFGGSGSGGPASEAELSRVVEFVREVAGADRTMIGSDWPMTRGRCDYAETIRRLDGLLAGWSAAERERTRSGTAISTYGLESGSGR